MHEVDLRSAKSTAVLSQLRSRTKLRRVGVVVRGIAMGAVLHLIVPRRPPRAMMMLCETKNIVKMYGSRIVEGSASWGVNGFLILFHLLVQFNVTQNKMIF